MGRVFVDTTHFTNIYGRDAAIRRSAAAIEAELVKRRFIRGRPDCLLSQHVYAETFHNLQEEIGFKRACEAMDEIRNACPILRVDEQTAAAAVSVKMAHFVNRQTGNPAVGFVDATSLALMEQTNVRMIISDDEGFDKYPLIRRITSANTVPDGPPPRKSLDRAIAIDRLWNRSVFRSRGVRL